jgi:glutamate racemase
VAFFVTRSIKMKQPIGVFDSGVGGLSVWKEIAALLPHEDIVYFADNANCPYGPKSQKEVIALSDAIVRFFISKDVKLVVVACNTATAAAIDYLRASYELPFVGMEPAVKPAAILTKTKCVGILATAGTLGGKLFKATTERYASDIKVVKQVGSGLVELVESGNQYGEKAEELLEKYVLPMIKKGADHIVLGCTHYPFFRPLVDRIAGEGVTIIDPAPAIARRVNDILEDRHLKVLDDDAPKYHFYSSGTSSTMKTLLEEVLHVDTTGVVLEENVVL